MKGLLLLTMAALLAIQSPAQEFVQSTTVVKTFRDNDAKAPRASSTPVHSQLASAGIWVALGGVVIGIAGIVEYKNATTNSVPFTVVNRSQQTLGTGIIILGAGAFVTGIVMVVAGTSQRHAHPKVSIIAPGGNELGLAYHL